MNGEAAGLPRSRGRRTVRGSCAFTVVVVSFAIGAGCGHRSPSATTDGGAPTASGRPPADHLAAGELPEGTEKAFAVVLPQVLRVRSRFGDDVLASGLIDCDALANYIRARVRDGTVTAGAGATIFDKVRAPADPDRLLHIRVQRGSSKLLCSAEFHDVTPPKLPDYPDQATQFKAMGLGPDGKLADPQHLQ